jgi:hypothetical protein
VWVGLGDAGNFQFGAVKSSRDRPARKLRLLAGTENGNLLQLM